VVRVLADQGTICRWHLLESLRRGDWQVGGRHEFERQVSVATAEQLAADLSGEHFGEKGGEFSQQSEQANQIYYEPRCYEGNIGYPSLMKSARLAEKLYSEGKGPHPATADNATDFVGVEENPLQ
jgi:hypothetical protein